MNALKATAFAVLAVMLLAFPARAGDGDVAATVNGDKILKKDVNQALKSANVPADQMDKLFPAAVDQMVNEKLVDAEIAKANLDADKDFQARAAAAKAQLMRAYFIEKYLADKVTAKKIDEEYAQFKKDNKGKQELHARHILVSTEEEAKKVIADLDKGGKFADLAKARSSDPAGKNGGDLGWFAEGEVVPEFSAAAFALKPGTYTKTPVKTQFGWHVIFVEAKRDRAVPELKTVEAAIRQKLSQQALADLVKDLRAKADVKITGAEVKKDTGKSAAPEKK